MKKETTYIPFNIYSLNNRLLELLDCILSFLRQQSLTQFEHKNNSYIYNFILNKGSTLVIINSGFNP